MNGTGITVPALTFVGYALYVADRSHFCPDTKGWGTVSLVGMTALLGGIMTGAQECLALLLMEFLCPLAITILSLRLSWRKKEKIKWEGDDTVFCCVVLAGIGCWIIFAMPAMVLLSSAILDWRFGLRTMRKAWDRPNTEPWLSWLVTTTACLMAVVAAAEEGPHESAYILSFTTMQTIILAILSKEAFGKARQAFSVSLPAALPAALPGIIPALPQQQRQGGFLPFWVWS